MSNFLDDWAQSSEKNKKICARENLIMNVTEDILIHMEDENISKRDLAKKLGKSPAYVSQILSGARNMTLRTLSDICFSLGLTPSLSFAYEDGNQLSVKEAASSHQWQKSDSDHLIVDNVYYLKKWGKKGSSTPSAGLSSGKSESCGLGSNQLRYAGQ
ncbi:helix-turn-helix transcriptional regulator [Sansalvadorimonas verongulae]|uniref:helix-turn-helix transcriptional regulator n=1 Tax=Sansalvadorimonas verongulae TaxID=2172824 RepID=UPI0012BBF1F2|nr:helix-turn-helix transcriptional regulator [Sansalvadorimonas verongulae]MTI12130.1 XRE family transcriptional regulator [Sansalvadorimonas verongulae]